ncbi:unnamed protein product [Symbiodinium sp. CCMP2456]|nr:unnamed protein product [Symbiodinium sp. CCMP2456]
MWALLHAERTWLELVQEDLSWAWQLRLKSGHAEHNIGDWDTAVSIISHSPGQWKSIVRHVKQTAAIELSWTAEVQQYHGLVFRQLRGVGALLADGVCGPDSHQELCACCGQVFQDLRAWSHHAFKVHGRRREERFLANGQQCPACSKHYPDTQKLCNHLRHSKKCKAQGPGKPLTQEDVVFEAAWCGWLEQATDKDDDWPIEWVAWHCRASKLLLQVAWVEWLIPEPASVPHDVATFRDAATLLPWLSFDSFILPTAPFGADIGRVIARDDLGTGEYVSHDTASARPELLDFASWPAGLTSLVTVLSGVGLVRSLEHPWPLSSFRNLEPSLARLRLFSDLVRDALYLWTRGAPCLLHICKLQCPAVQALRAAAPFTLDGSANVVLGNVACQEFASAFTL